VTEEAHGGPGHTGERDTAQDLQEDYRTMFAVCTERDRD
jgi:hypothetical protein